MVRDFICATLRLLLGFMFFIGVPLLQAQAVGIPTLSQEEIASHLMMWVAPVYPAIAQAARVQGEVEVRVEIGPDGLVRSARVLSGPSFLRQSASDAITHWRYDPFHEGDETIAVMGNVLVSFNLGNKPAVHTPHEPKTNGSYSVTVEIPPPDTRGQPDKEIADRFEKMWNECSRGVIAHMSSAETADACKKAAEIADEFPADSRYIERRSSFVYAATAFANIRDLRTALVYANKAVEIVSLGHDDNSGCEAAFSVRGEIRAFSGDLTGADKDLSTAEDFARKAKSPALLKRDLQFHAELLNRMGRSQEAQTKLNEAAKQ